MKKVLEGEILLPGEAEANARREESVRKGFWKTLAKAAGKLPFMDDVVASYYCALDPATPNRTRAILLGALAYFVMPLDWIPDFILGFGFSDDIAVLTAAFAAIKGSIRESHYTAAREALAKLRSHDDPDAKKDSEKQAA
ncbi:MAG: YkvA family protein [Nitratireductor sp.]